MKCKTCSKETLGFGPTRDQCQTCAPVMRFYNVYYYDATDPRSTPDKPYHLGRWYWPTEAETKAQTELAQRGAQYRLVRLEDHTDKCDYCHTNPTSHNRYVKSGDIWYHLCEACYQAQLQADPRIWTLNRSMDAVGEALVTGQF